MKLPAPNRIAVYITAAAGLATAVAPVVASLDLTSTIGIVSGFAGLVGVVNKWLTGWQQTEKHVQQDELHQRAVAREAAARAEATAQAVAPRPPAVKLPR